MRAVNKYNIIIVPTGLRMSTEMEALSAAKWPLYLDSEGRILDEYTVRKIAFHKVSAES